jgi:hypothetical protein
MPGQKQCREGGTRGADVQILLSEAKLNGADRHDPGESEGQRDVGTDVGREGAPGSFRLAG